MKKFEWKHHLGYGILPASSIVLSLYVYSFSFYLHDLYPSILTISFIFSFGLILFGLFKRSWSLDNILSHTGFKFLDLRLRFYYFITYYFIFLITCYLCNEKAFFAVNSLVLIIVPIIFFIASDIFIKGADSIVVPFARITPRVYLDLLNNDRYTLKQMNDLDITYQNVDDELNIEKLLNIYHSYKEFKYSKREIPLYSDKKEIVHHFEYEVEEDLNKINITAYNNDSEKIWQHSFSFQAYYNTYKLDKETINEILDAIKFLEA